MFLSLFLPNDNAINVFLYILDPSSLHPTTLPYFNFQGSPDKERAIGIYGTLPNKKKKRKQSPANNPLLSPTSTQPISGELSRTSLRRIEGFSRLLEFTRMQVAMDESSDDQSNSSLGWNEMDVSQSLPVVSKFSLENIKEDGEHTATDHVNAFGFTDLEKIIGDDSDEKKVEELDQTEGHNNTVQGHFNEDSVNQKLDKDTDMENQEFVSEISSISQVKNEDEAVSNKLVGDSEGDQSHVKNPDKLPSLLDPEEFTHPESTSGKGDPTDMRPSEEGNFINKETSPQPVEEEEASFTHKETSPKTTEKGSYIHKKETSPLPAEEGNFIDRETSPQPVAEGSFIQETGSQLVEEGSFIHKETSPKPIEEGSFIHKKESSPQPIEEGNFIDREISNKIVEVISSSMPYQDSEPDDVKLGAEIASIQENYASDLARHDITLEKQTDETSSPSRTTLENAYDRTKGENVIPEKRSQSHVDDLCEGSSRTQLSPDTEEEVQQQSSLATQTNRTFWDKVNQFRPSYRTIVILGIAVIAGIVYNVYYN